MLPCKVNIVSNNLIAVVIPQFEIGLIEYLVIPVRTCLVERFL